MLGTELARRPEIHQARAELLSSCLPAQVEFIRVLVVIAAVGRDPFPCMGGRSFPRVGRHAQRRIGPK
eukprot:4672829-Alexandrium_andersonii.AAC.1